MERDREAKRQEDLTPRQNIKRLYERVIAKYSHHKIRLREPIKATIGVDWSYPYESRHAYMNYDSAAIIKAKKNLWLLGRGDNVSGSASYCAGHNAELVIIGINQKQSKNREELFGILENNRENNSFIMVARNSLFGIVLFDIVKNDYLQKLIETKPNIRSILENQVLKSSKELTKELIGVISDLLEEQTEENVRLSKTKPLRSSI